MVRTLRCVPPVLLLLSGAARAEPDAARAAYSALVTQEAERRGLPPALGNAVATVESNWNPAAQGADGEVGLMQVLPSTAAMLGFRGSPAELADPATNIRLGVTYLSGAWFLAGGNLCNALMKYRAGHGEEAMSPRSAEYCERVRQYLVSVGSPLGATAAVPVVARSSVGGAVRLHPRPHAFIGSMQFWAAWSRSVGGPHSRRARALAAQ